jgi:hypothetical protein
MKRDKKAEKERERERERGRQGGGRERERREREGTEELPADSGRVIAGTIRQKISSAEYSRRGWKKRGGGGERREEEEDGEARGGRNIMDICELSRNAY